MSLLRHKERNNMMRACRMFPLNSRLIACQPVVLSATADRTCLGKDNVTFVWPTGTGLISVSVYRGFAKVSPWIRARHVNVVVFCKVAHDAGQFTIYGFCVPSTIVESSGCLESAKTVLLCS